MTADIVVGGLGGDGPIVTAGLGFSAVQEVSVGTMIPADVEVPWMLAAAVDEALMAAVDALTASMDPADLAKATATGDYSHTAMAALSTSTATTRPATTARATAASTHRATATLTPASTATAAMTGTATATATIERS